MNTIKVYVHFVNGWVEDLDLESTDFVTADDIKEYIYNAFDVDEVRFVTIGALCGYKIEF